MSLLNNPFNNQKYIQKEDRSKEKQSSTEKTRQKKFQKLYNDYKTQKTKEEEYRQKMLSEREKKELAECSFNPKITKNNSLYKKKPFEAITQEERNKNKIKGHEKLKSDSKIINLINRQNKWLENKNNKLNQRIVSDAIKKVEGCVFEPKIKNISNKMSSNLKIESHKLVEKPDSYLNFINKTKKYRESKNSGSKDYTKIKNWKSPYRNKIIMDNDYDYTKHELTENNYLLKNNSSSNYNVNISNSMSTKSFNNKEKMKKSIPISKLKLTNISNDELYSMIYYNEKEKINKSLNIYLDENIQKLFGDKNQIYFRQAMEGLHESLINLKISDDEDEIELKSNENEDLNENSNGNQNENENNNDNENENENENEKQINNN